ncbi:MAG: penicillin-binding protein [Clostridia bacterium]|nr:penicillin-binding protein [Clostridia bacterium]
MIKRIIAAFCVVFAAAMILVGCAPKSPSVIVSSNGEIMAELTQTTWGSVEPTEEGYKSYVDAVIRETLDILCEQKNLSLGDADKILRTKGYRIETVFDEGVYKSMTEAQTSMVDNMAAAVTDLKGRVLAIYSVSDENNEHRNLACTSFYPCSAFKPLSVYAPALESGTISWSTMTVDSPVKKIEDAVGSLRDWPSNASGTYTNSNMDIKTAIKESINTVAVKTLINYGSANSAEFLSDNFGIDMSYETQQINAGREEDVLDNIALGYLAAGVNTVDMAGYYQIFANGGIYVKPYTIAKIIDDLGKVIYEAEPIGYQIISPETAFIMNSLLQEVVMPGGTGQAAGHSGKLVGGKTGTGENLAEGWNDNWFVGFTPEYTCAVWHSARMTSNVAAALFAELTDEIVINENAIFPPNENVKQIAYCTESGKRIGDNCKGMEIGWFMHDEIPEKCEEH